MLLGPVDFTLFIRESERFQAVNVSCINVTVILSGQGFGPRYNIFGFL